MADAAYERVLCVKNEVMVYKIPPRPSNRGYRADEWKLDAPDWTGRLRVVSKGKDLLLKLEDRNSGELFAQCPVEEYPSIAIESVMDSSRYFVIRIKDDGGRSAFIGIGFHDRSDSFDLNVSIQDHFKWLKQEAEDIKISQEPGPKLDLGFKEGQTIKINIGNKKEGASRPRAKPAGGVGFLPPPPGGAGKIPAPLAGPPAAKPAPAAAAPAPQASSNVSLLGDFAAPPPAAPPASSAPSTDLWGDFTGAGSQPPSSSSGSAGSNWVQF